MKKISVILPYVREEIYIGGSILSTIASKITRQNYDKILVFIDSNVKKNSAALIEPFLTILKPVECVTVKPIPRYKTYEQAGTFLKHMVRLQLTRKSCLVAIGGGYVADIVGFIASIYMRGIDFVQVPSTLMAMGDAVIGKVAVNYEGHKNVVGSFYSPRFVACEASFLKTLDKQEQVYGLVEVWKHAILKNSTVTYKKIGEWFVENSTTLNEELIYFSLKTKRSYVEKDFDDSNGSHKALSLGHTFANYFERFFALRHGEAVFYGIVLATLLAERLKLLSHKKKQAIFRTAHLFESYVGSLKKLQSRIVVHHLLHHIKFDKINHTHTYTFVVPTEGGHAVQKNIQEEILREVVQEFKTIKGL